MAATLNDLHQEAWDRALAAVATARIFERRSRKLRQKLRLLSFIGLLGPLLVGALALSYGVGFSPLPLLIAIASAVAVLQAAISLWSVSANWSGSLEVALHSIIVNRELFDRFSELGRSTLIESELRVELTVLKSRDDAQRSVDLQQEITEVEKRFGMRSALIRLRRTCVQCADVPSSMNPTNCGVCGDFSAWKFRER